MAEDNWWQDSPYATAASAGGSARGASAAANPDKEELFKAQEKADAADKSLRLYGAVEGALRRFDPGPTKGTMYGALMPDEGGGFWDGVGSTIGAIPRAIGFMMPRQDQDDYARIQSARAERIGIRAQEQAGVQAKNDEIQFKLADISPYKSLGVNREIVGRARREALDQKLAARVQSKWVAKYGSTANPSPSGRTYNQAVDMARRELFGDSKPGLPSAPPSTRKASAAKRTVYDINGNPIK